MMAVKIQSNLGKMAGALERRIRDEYVRRVLTAANISIAAIRHQIDEWTSRTSTAKTGALAKSFSAVLTRGRNGEIGANVVSSSKYAGIHEGGGTIKPKGQALTIPITQEARGKSARSFGGRLFIVRKQGHLPVLAEKKGKKGIKPHYILKKSVYITPKHYLTKAAEESEDEIAELLAEGTEIAIDDVGAGPKR